MRGAMLGLAAGIVFTALYSVSVSLFALHTLGLSPVGFAVLTQCFIAGRMAGSRLGARVTHAGAQRSLVAAGVAMGLGLLLPGLVPNPWLAGLSFGFAGAANAVQVAAIRLIVVHAVDDSARARALSTMGSVNTAAMLCGYVIGAPAVALLSPVGGLVLAGLGTMSMVGLGVAVTWWLTHRDLAQPRARLDHQGTRVPIGPTPNVRRFAYTGPPRGRATPA